MNIVGLTKNQEGRIEWIDALKGFTIILVVFSHVELYSLGMRTSASALNSFFITFRMPLFFFLSGFVAFRVDKVWTSRQLFCDIKKKLRIQLIPMLFFGSIYTLIKNQSISSFFLDTQHHGYWFTLVLLEIFLLYFSISFFCYNKCKNKWTEDIILVLLAGGLCLLNCFTESIRDNSIYNILSCGYFFGHFLWFVSGHLCSKYFHLFQSAISNPYSMAAFVLSWAGSFYLTGLNWSEDFFPRSIHFIINLLTSLWGIIVVVSFFIKNRTMFSQSTIKGRTLQYIGRRTLDIYLLHFFLLPVIPKLGGFFLKQPNIVLEGTLVFCISLLIVAFCILISNIIRLSPFLSHWLFGVKYTTVDVK